MTTFSEFFGVHKSHVGLDSVDVDLDGDMALLLEPFGRRHVQRKNEVLCHEKRGR